MVPPGNITNKAIVDPTLHEDGSWLGGGDWQIIPNPDWEKFDVNVAHGVMLSGVWVYTISIVPEPSAFLFGGLICGVIGLGWSGRRMLQRLRLGAVG
jgi:hypothetical protein